VNNSDQSRPATSTKLLPGQIHETAVGTFGFLLLDLSNELGSTLPAELLPRRVCCATVSASDHLLHITDLLSYLIALYNLHLTHTSLSLVICKKRLNFSPKYEPYVIIATVKVSELGEFGLIELLAEIVDGTKNPKDDSWQRLLIGIGDDAAAWQVDSGIQLATTDSLVQDTHFDLNIITWEELGWKAIAVNLSDIAAMGGTPKYALISLALPGELKTDSVSSLYWGMAQIASRFGVAIVGGNIASANKTIINVTVLGSLESVSALTRSAVVPGDLIAVTGYLGLSAAGLRMLKQHLKFDVDSTQLLRRAHLKPMPRVDEGRILLQHGVKAAIDISDGLISDLTHICQESKVSARINQNALLIHPALKNNFKSDYLQLALSGGEDYELLFTASSQTIDRIKKAVPCAVTVIGEITQGKPGQVAIIDAEGKNIPWQKAGWEHFKSRA
jgi:thiamine-monophosphate kinase